MKKSPLPTADLTVDDIMQRWPSAIRVFLDFGMHCVGCPIATFHSVDEACNAHGILPDAFLRDLQAAAQSVQVSRPAGAGCDCPSASLNNP